MRRSKVGKVGAGDVAVPVNTVAPTLSGTASDGQTISSSTGTWTNTPLSYSYIFKDQLGNVLRAASSVSTYSVVTADIGKTITCYVQATNALGSSAYVPSNSLGPVTSAGGGSLATPTLARYSSAGAAPLELTISSTDYVVGLRGQLQIDNNSDFSSPEQNIVFFIDGDSWARLDEAIGLITPTGTYYARFRVLRDNESGATTVTDQIGNTFTADASSWSNTVTDTISTSVAVLSTASADKSEYITRDSAYQAHCNATTGANNSIRTDTAQVNQKGHFEFRIDAIVASGGLCFGIADSGAVTPLSPSVFPSIGQNRPGATCRVDQGSTTATVFANGTNVGFAVLPAAPAAGDALIIDHDYTAHTVHFRWYRASGATITNITTITMTSQIPATPYAVGAGAASGDTFTFNPGNATFLVTPDTGFTYYG